MSKVVTANNLVTGAVVFMGRADAWVGDIAVARVYEDAATVEAALAAAKSDEKRALIVDPFVVDLEQGRAGPGMSLRDSIRAHGPTIAYLPTSPAGAA